MRRRARRSEGAVDIVAMTRLTSVYGSFRARVMAARLEDEGFDVQLRGALDGPYGLTVGDMARVDVYVPDEQFDQASLVLLVSEVDEADEILDDDRSPIRARPVPLFWVAALILFVLDRGPDRVADPLVLADQARSELSSSFLIRRNARRGRDRSRSATSS